MLSGFKNIIIACTIAFVVGGVAGWRVEAWRSNAAYYQAQVARLQTQLDAANAAAAHDAVQAQMDSERIDELQRKVEDAEDHTSSGECLPADDSERVRDLWN